MLTINHKNAISASFKYLIKYIPNILQQIGTANK